MEEEHVMYIAVSIFKCVGLKLTKASKFKIGKTLNIATVYLQTQKNLKKLFTDKPCYWRGDLIY